LLKSAKVVRDILNSCKNVLIFKQHKLTVQWLFSANNASKNVKYKNMAKNIFVKKDICCNLFWQQ